VIWNTRLKRLKLMGRERAEALDMAPELLLRRRDIEALIRTGSDEGADYALPPGLQGWRQEVIGDDLLAQLRRFEQ
jgi:ribonuclease D